jgi:rod shape-determining protein MreC
MAIAENRIKAFNIVPVLIMVVWSQLVRFFAALLICFSLLLWYLSYTSSSSMSNRLVVDIYSSAITPILAIFDATLDGIVNFKAYISDMTDAHYENIALKLENSRLQKLLEKTSYVYSENTFLKSHIKLVDPIVTEYTFSARVISIVRAIYSHVALINVGSDDGACNNQVVVGDGGIIGRIVNVYNRYAKVMLVTDIQSRIPVVTSISGQRAILSGDGRHGGELLYVSDCAEVKLGEMILSSGDGKYYPYGIPVAQVVDKIGNKIYAEPIVKLSNTKFVSIIQELQK